MTSKEINHVGKIMDRIGICNCGTEPIWPIVMTILERAENHDENGSFYDAHTDASANWVEFAAHVLDSRPWGLITHGTGIGWGWLTEDGEQVLTFLEEYGFDESEWPSEVFEVDN